MTAIDSFLLLAFVVVSVTLGKPLSLVQNVKQGGSVGLYTWAGSTRLNCLETKAIWGLCIALW
jgi:hypothetical protein